jgi:ABC-2 type transport system ATP-binding protein
VAIDDVSVQIRRGEVLAILGPNGAGKTTLINLLLGRLEPDSGSVELFGHAPRDLAARRRTGAMFQVGSVPGTIKVREHIELFCSYYPAPMALESVVEAAGLTGLEERYFDKLSGGQQQRLLFALAICGNPELVFLDEPTVGMDVEARRLFWGVIRKLVNRGSTVVLTTHYLEEADALADRIIMLANGEIAASGTPETIKSMAGARIIRCRADISEEHLQSLAAIQQVRANGNRVEIHSSEPENVLRELLSMDQGLSDLTVTGVALEDAFLNLTDSAQNPLTTETSNP